MQQQLRDYDCGKIVIKTYYAENISCITTNGAVSDVDSNVGVPQIASISSIEILEAHGRMPLAARLVSCSIRLIGA
jgi:hypothetical protein